MSVYFDEADIAYERTMARLESKCDCCLECAEVPCPSVADGSQCEERCTCDDE